MVLKPTIWPHGARPCTKYSLSQNELEAEVWMSALQSWISGREHFIEPHRKTSLEPKNQLS